MKKQRVTIGFIAILIAVGLSGCQEKQTGDNTNIGGNEAVIISSSVVTTWRDSQYHEEPGFFHDFPDNAIYNSHYVINGAVKNTAGRLIDEMLITAVFYDADNNELFRSDRTEGMILNFPDGSTRNFTFSIDFYDSEDYLSFDHVDFVITVS
jgi:hypothetical protein